jgi:hypothetical protein
LDGSHKLNGMKINSEKEKVLREDSVGNLKITLMALISKFESQVMLWPVAQEEKG